MAEEAQGRSIVFMGTPAIARDILAGLAGQPHLRILAVYTQPDRPAGRGKKLVPSPVKVLALELGLDVRQPVSLRKDEAECARLVGLAPDFLVVAAYGMILPASVLSAPVFAPLNVHTSLLPAWRGAAPVQRALMNGDAATGVSIMKIEEELDAGPVYKCIEVPTAGETSGSLLAKMGRLAVPALLEVMDGVVQGTCTPKPQEGVPTYAAKIRREDGVIDFCRPARLVDCQVRAVIPDPGAAAVFRLGDDRVAVLLEEVCTSPMSGFEPGTVLAKKGELFIACSDVCLQVLRLKPLGRKSMDAASFVNGRRLASRELVPVGSIVRGED